MNLRVLAVGNVFAAYQIHGIYPFEVYAHRLGHKLCATSRLPEAFYLYATKDCPDDERFSELLSVLNKVRPKSSLDIHCQCIIGIVVLEEISAVKARLVNPHIPILENASQILHITKRTLWREPFSVVSVPRFDRWPQLGSDLTIKLHLHSDRMSSYLDSPVLTPPGTPELPQLDLGSFYLDEEEQGGEVTSTLQVHPRSTRSIELYGPATIIRAHPEVLSFKGLKSIPRQRTDSGELVPVLINELWTFESSKPKRMRHSPPLLVVAVLEYASRSIKLEIFADRVKGPTIVAADEDGGLFMFTFHMAKLRDQITEVTPEWEANAASSLKIAYSQLNNPKPAKEIKLPQREAKKKSLSLVEVEDDEEDEEEGADDDEDEEEEMLRTPVPKKKDRKENKKAKEVLVFTKGKQKKPEKGHDQKQEKERQQKSEDAAKELEEDQAEIDALVRELAKYEDEVARAAKAKREKRKTELKSALSLLRLRAAQPTSEKKDDRKRTAADNDDAETSADNGDNIRIQQKNKDKGKRSVHKDKGKRSLPSSSSSSASPVKRSLHKDKGKRLPSSSSSSASPVKPRHRSGSRSHHEPPKMYSPDTVSAMVRSGQDKVKRKLKKKFRAAVDNNERRQLFLGALASDSD